MHESEFDKLEPCRTSLEHAKRQVTVSSLCFDILEHKENRIKGLKQCFFMRRIQPEVQFRSSISFPRAYTLHAGKVEMFISNACTNAQMWKRLPKFPQPIHHIYPNHGEEANLFALKLHK
ncbi:unnamed protein product [Cylicocyclus nassatus]|uniref:Uncharacterized protein n=1 Tax=Cylicocyclus nassatus TaxID=53992 RepID=A0AA36DQM2_CYLNA|nr:unnamed protein product [Cylicocyclus nassatus]